MFFNMENVLFSITLSDFLYFGTHNTYYCQLLLPYSQVMINKTYTNPILKDERGIKVFEFSLRSLENLVRKDRVGPSCQACNHTCE